jgi:putative protein-disulfide isomerase
MGKPTLHYIFDPLCGWCYGAAPLVEAARTVAGLKIAFHGGGMMTGANRQQITPEWRGYVLPHDMHIAQLSGQTFGGAYTEGLLNDTTAMMDSAPPTTAILAAEALDERGLDMLHRLQRAHYVEGRRIADAPVLRELAAGIGLDARAFEAQYDKLKGKATQAHIADSRAMLERVGGRGFPSFALEDDKGLFATLDTAAWLGQPGEWAAELARIVGVAAAPA